jgi:hypothetical protein
MRTLDSIYQFVGGKIIPLTDPPQWLTDAHIAYRETDDFLQALSDQGAEIVERYGDMNESIDVWRCNDCGWFVDWQDIDSPVMSIYIADVIDFAAFNTAWLCSMAMKIMASDAYIRVMEERQALEEKKEASVH